MPTIRNANDGSNRPPRAEVCLCLGTLHKLPEWSAAPTGEPHAVLEAIAAAGFAGVQGGDVALCHELGLLNAGSGRISTPADADEQAARWADAGYLCATAHAGWGLESDAEVDALVGAIIEASVRRDLPIYIETHRSTITQDIWRTVQLVRRFPGLRFNGDFSHWYTGLEMPYMGVDRACDFAAPVFERVRYLHGRIGSSGSMQVDVGDTLDEALATDFVQHFVQMWVACVRGFFADAQPGDVLMFSPELLASGAHYARVFPGPDGERREECDRWQQALFYKQIFEHCVDLAGA